MVWSMRAEELVAPAPSGLYCAIGDFYIDPTRPVTRAVITHGHADHARAGHSKVLATAPTLAIMAARYGRGFADAAEAAPYGVPTTINGVAVTLLPAGHVLGSAQVLIEYRGLRIVVSGDYKRRRDPTTPAFEPVPAHVFITEATFGLPIFRHPPDAAEVAKLLHSLALFPDRPHLVGVYSLGKAQRLIALLREAGYGETLYCHGALTPLNALYERHGVTLGPTASLEGVARGALDGALILAPPSALADRWSRKLGNAVRAFASGWMGVRARARQRAVELPLVISDHADWTELTATLDDMTDAEIWVTHGNEEALVHYAQTRGRRARPLSLVGYDEDSGDDAAS